MKPIYYFAYGSNMDIDQMRRRCPNAKCVDTAVLHDWKFALDEVGYATVCPAAGMEVPGLLWMLLDTDEAALDCYEGVGSGCYQKARVTVTARRIPQHVEALVYISLRGENDGARVPGYMGTITQAAKRAGFDDDYLGMLKDLWVGYANADYRTPQAGDAPVDADRSVSGHEL